MRPDLARMKSLALALLASVTVLYAIATFLESRDPAWAYVAAFSEAAMVGAVADWFAVVALFRHPMGLPIPHTAIIPRNKARIGENLANFICANFLSTAQVLEKLRSFDPAFRVGTWLAQPRHAAQVAGHLAATLHYALQALDDERVRNFFRDTALRRLEQVDFARVAGQLLGLLTADRRHQAVLDGALRQLSTLLGDEELQKKIAEAIASEVKVLKVIGLDDVAGRYAMSKVVAGVTRLVAEMADDAEHPLRLRFDAFVGDYIARLQDDPELRLKGEGLKQELLAHPALAGYLQSLWGELIDWVDRDLASERSTLRTRLKRALVTVGRQLQSDVPMQAWINEQLVTQAPRWIDRYREDIRLYIVARVGAWNTDEMTRELERNIGRDLQFIRINGTLVGGLAGLLIHALTQWARAG